MVFRNEGPLHKNEKWYIDGKTINTVSHYKYLRERFSSRLEWSQAIDTLASKAQKSVNVIKTLYYKCNGLPLDLAFNLFDKMVVPIFYHIPQKYGVSYIMIN